MATKLNEDSEIRKSKALVFAQMSPTNLPLPAQRLFMALLANIDIDSDQTSFIIAGKDIASIADLPSNVVGQQLEEMSIKADALRQYTIVIQEDDGNFLRSGLLSSTKYLKGQRSIRIGIDPYLLPHLKKMKEQFVISYKAAGAMKFKSEYSLPFYDMMLYYLREGGYHYFTIDEVRKMFNIPDGKVKLISTLNQKVIKPAMRDVNLHTNLEVTMKQETKQGSRATIGYHFYIKDKNQECIEESNREIEEIMEMLVNPPYRFNKYTLMKLIDKYGIESIKNNFNYTKSKSPNNFSRYLYWSITNQIFEREKEIEQIQKVNKNFVIDTPLPKYREKVEALFPVIEEHDPDYKEIDKKELYERIKNSNPKLYEIIKKVNKSNGFALDE